VNGVTIRTGGGSYEALVGRGLLETIGERARGLVNGPRCAVVVDANTAGLFGETVSRSLRGAGFLPALLTMPAGEKAKSLEQLGRLCDEMAAAGLDRSSFVVAVGGGVVGDLAGFAAAIYHRGIPHVQVPTTLLAQVDSSIGGKTAINTAAGKNLLGAVHQPSVVIADVDTLRTLPAREFRQGFAEIIKHAIIADPDLFGFLDELAASPDVAASSSLAELIRRNIGIKAAIVAGDEQDRTGERAILNFGHTVGHAIERAAGYGQLLHGEAVSLGIVAACSVSVLKAGLAETARDRVVTMLEAFQLPTKLPANLARDDIMRALEADKKFERAEVRFVVTPALGSARLTSDVTRTDIAAAVATL
jgi:3-dehydroquinate synthase